MTTPSSPREHLNPNLGRVDTCGIGRWYFMQETKSLSRENLIVCLKPRVGWTISSPVCLLWGYVWFLLVAVRRGKLCGCWNVKGSCQNRKIAFPSLIGHLPGRRLMPVKSMLRRASSGKLSQQWGSLFNILLPFFFLYPGCPHVRPFVVRASFSLLLPLALLIQSVHSYQITLPKASLSYVTSLPTKLPWLSFPCSLILDTILKTLP